MATPEQCPEYSRCGFVQWRIDRPDLHIAPLPENGDCGKSVVLCGRLDKSPHPGIKLSVEDYGPQTDEELRIGFPEIPNTNGRPPRRLVGSGSR